MATSICWILCSQVHGAGCHRVPWRNPSIWFHFHRNVSVLQCYWGTLFKMIQTAMLKWGFFVFFSPHVTGTSSSHLSGPTKSTMCMASWCWSWLSCALWLCVSPLCVHTFFSMLRTTDGEFFPHGSLEYQPQSWGIVILSSILILVCLSLSSRQWTSFLSAASTAVYVYMYSFYYYFFKTKWVLLFINPMKHPVVEVLTSYTPLTFYPVVFQDVWAVPDILLLWLHGCVQHCPGNHVW